MVDWGEEFVDGEKCVYCGERPAQQRFYLHPCWYFCSMDCKIAYYESPDEFPRKPTAGTATDRG